MSAIIAKFMNAAVKDGKPTKLGIGVIGGCLAFLILIIVVLSGSREKYFSSCVMSRWGETVFVGVKENYTWMNVEAYPGGGGFDAKVHGLKVCGEIRTSHNKQDEFDKADYVDFNKYVEYAYDLRQKTFGDIYVAEALFMEVDKATLCYLDIDTEGDVYIELWVEGTTDMDKVKSILNALVIKVK